MIKFMLFIWSQITLSCVLYSLIVINWLMSSVSHCSKVITLTGFHCTNIIHNFINIIGIVLIWLLLSFSTKLITLRDFHCIKRLTKFNYPLKIKCSFLQFWGKKKRSFFLCKSDLINCEIHWKIQFKSVSIVNQTREKVCFYWEKTENNSNFHWKILSVKV